MMHLVLLYYQLACQRYSRTLLPNSYQIHLSAFPLPSVSVQVT